MARRERTVYEITDDLTGEELEEQDAEVLEFTVHGQAYVMDVAKKTAADFYKFMAKYEDAAKKVEPEKAKTGTRSRGKAAPSDDLAAIRTWATANGHTVADRGRVAKTIRDAYYEANPKK